MNQPMIPPVNSSYIKRYFNKVALIDADRYKHVVVYRVYQRLQEGAEHSPALVDEVISQYLANDIFEKFDARGYIFCFSAPSKNVFRNFIAQEKEYKGNRKNQADLYDYEQKWSDMAYVYEYVKNRYTAVIAEDLEADDLLSMMQRGEDTFIFSHDKDLKQVVGYHYDMDINQLLYTDEEDSIRILAHQILTGDTTDHIPGLSGFGAKAGEKFLMECADKNQDEVIKCCLEKFIEKLGPLHGTDTFVEMWNLVSMKLNRGAYLRDRYVKAFATIDALLTEKV